MSGPRDSYIVTLVERHSRYVMLAKVADKSTRTVVSALIKQAKKLPNELFKSLTWDQGKELTDHRRFSLGWCRKVGGKLENWRKLRIVKYSERRCAAAERSLRHETSYGIDVAQSIFR